MEIVSAKFAQKIVMIVFTDTFCQIEDAIDALKFRIASNAIISTQANVCNACMDTFGMEKVVEVVQLDAKDAVDEEVALGHLLDII